MLNFFEGEFCHPLHSLPIQNINICSCMSRILLFTKERKKNHVHLRNKSSSSSISRWKTPKSVCTKTNKTTHFSVMPNNKKLELEDSSQ